MATAPAIDLEPLLQPISADSRSGADLRADPSPTSPYYQVKDARGAARSDERQGLFGGVIGSAEAERWRPVIDLAPQILTGQSKDLEVVAFLTEALCRANGFAGLRDGFRLAREYVERYWDELHPMPDEYGVETRVAPIAGLNGSGGAGVLLNPIARIPITEGADVGPFATWNVDQAIELERLDPDKRAERIAAGAIDMESVRKAVAQTDPAFYAVLVDDLTGAQEEWKALSDALQQRAGGDAPPSSQVREALDDVMSRIRHIAKDRLPVEQPAAPEGGDAGADGAAASNGSPGGPPAAAAGPIASREQAFQKLGEIADFFRRTEPHSPLPYLLERAVRWGHTPLPELLAELIPDQGARSTFNALTGVQPQDEPKP